MVTIWNQLTGGIKKFCHQNGFNDITLGLSGGLDSALTAVAAADALGGSHVHALMMATRHTSTLSLQIARKIAEINGLDFKEMDINPLIDEQKTFLRDCFGNEPRKSVVENLQARERGKILMAFSNQYGWLVLACSNRSEIAMGYCTLYGDTCGALAPLGALYKSQIFELARWRNTISQALPMEVIIRAPSAELSPAQKDEDSLPPYALLDKILTLYQDKEMSAAQITAEGFDAVTVEEVIKRCRDQAFKRCQLPPALPLTCDSTICLHR